MPPTSPTRKCLTTKEALRQEDIENMFHEGWLIGGSYFSVVKVTLDLALSIHLFVLVFQIHQSTLITNQL